MKTMLQGNMCSCGKVWFSLLIPESEPSFCPFCGKKLEYDADQYNESQREFMENIQNGDSDLFKDGGKQLESKAQQPMKLVSKICNFCTNETYFEEIDANTANVCPYCAGDLRNNFQDQHQTMNDLKNALMAMLDMSELIGKTVSIKMRSLNPFNKPKDYIFLGMEQISLLLKLKDCHSGNNMWMSITDIKYIMEIESSTSTS